MQDIHFISIHGFRGSIEQDYHKYLRDKLGAYGYKVEIPLLPNPEQPHETEQVKAVLDQTVIDENTVIIAHSLGCAVAMKILENLSFSVKALLLVAPVVEPEYCIPEHAHLAYWQGFDFSYDYAKIAANAKVRMILSDLTEYEVRGEYCRYLSAKIDAQLREVNALRKHLTGYEEPEVLRAAKDIIGFSPGQN